MSRNGQLEAGLKRMAEDYHLPEGGRKKLSQLVAEHLHRFDAAEKRAVKEIERRWSIANKARGKVA